MDRRLVRTRRQVLVAAGAVALLAPLTAAAAQADQPPPPGVACQSIPLPVPAGTSSEVTGGDPTGRYLVGHVREPNGSSRVGALWNNGQHTAIDASSIPNAQMDYHDVNRHGVVVGERMTDHQTFHTDAFTYRDGKFTFLPALRPGDSTQALGINSRGDVVGNSSGDGWTPVVWPANRPGTVRVLPMPSGHQGDGKAVGIDEDGSVVGYLSPYPPGAPYLWPAKGKPRPLSLPTGSIGGNAVAIQAGMVAGNVYDAPTYATVPTLWNARTGSLTLHKNVQAGALSVNRDGTIGVGGALVHADGRVSSVGDGAMVNTVDDRGVAAGATAQFNGQAVRWIGC
ncbi:hypothetical protein [Actinophytocola sp.]|uniref:hypothetical protein n=1 Tax=Actinophytocola sp. TaxID=1872138 RepID=UPI002ED2FBCB